MDHAIGKSSLQHPERRHAMPLRMAGVLACSVMAGCLDWSALTSRATDSAEAAADVSPEDGEADRNADPFADADITPPQRPLAEAARPFIEAVVSREYATAFDHLAPSAREKLSRNQFALAKNESEYAQHESNPVLSPTAEQFVELMQATEARFGPPQAIDYVTVETGSDVLSRSDPLMAAFELGNMPDSIPLASRKAAVQAWVDVAFSDEEVRALATADGISEEQVRNSRDDYEGPYFKIRTVVVDEGSGPVVGYFEIAPPSIWD